MVADSGRQLRIAKFFDVGGASVAYENSACPNSRLWMTSNFDFVTNDRSI